MHCPNCGDANADDARFCTNCGSPLDLTCPVCGASADAGDRFCRNCGSQLPWAGGEQLDKAAVSQRADAQSATEAEAERREVTVLFADLSGFTHWSSTLDPEETHALLNRYFEAADEIVRSFGGRVDKHIGDAVMAVFGAPISHGNDSERAVRAALEIHDALETFEPPLSAHIGIANGVVVASRTGSDTHREYTVTGNSVNLAARLQDLAGHGESLASDSVRNALGGIFAWEPKGETAIKGLDEPVAVWRVAGIGDADSGRLQQGFVGRLAELGQFTSALRTCADSGKGSAIRLRGEPGIGKSRLAEEFRNLAREAGFKNHVGLVLDFGTGRGRDAVGAIVRSFLSIDSTASADSLRDAALGAVADGLITEGELVHLNDLLDVAQSAELRSIYDAMDQSDRTRGKEAALVHLAEGAARRSPVLIAVEDIQWADAGTLSHLADLAASTANAPILLVMTTRFEGDPIDGSWRAQAHGARLTTIDLAPLTPAEASELAESEFDIAEELVRTCIERAAGNPLFLEQLLRSANEVDQETLPGTVQSIVQSRIDALAPEDRHALQAASILGQRFSPAAVCFLLDDASYSCAHLVEHFLIRPAGDDYMFTHALVRDGVYSSLITSRRKELHGRAADWFADRDLTLRAEHLGRVGDERAAGAYAAAARAEAETHHIDRALALSEEGLKLTEGVDRHELACLRGDLLRGLGSIDLSIAAFRGALSVAADNVGEVRALIGLAEGMRVSGQLADAIDHANQANEKVGSDQPLLSAEIHHLRGNLFFPAGDVRNCLKEHEAAVQYARLAESKEWEARALSGLGDASYLAARMRTGCAYFKRCVALSQELGLGRTEVANRHMIGWTRIYLNELTEARADGEAAVELAQRAGQTRAELLSRQLLALVYLDIGDRDAAIAQSDGSIGLARRLDHGHFIVQGLWQKAQALILAGQPRDALAPLDEGIGILRKVGMTFVGPMVLTLRGIVADDLDARHALFAEAEAILAEGCVSHNYFWAYRERIETALEDHDWDTAEQFADKLERYAADEPLPWSDLFVAAGRAVARTGRGEKGAALTAELHRLLDQVAAAGFARPVRYLESALASQPRPAPALSSDLSGG